MASFDDLNSAPDYGATKRSKPNVQSVKFGDGYEQRAAFGINTLPEIWDLKFAARDETEANAIDDFLADKGGVTAFSWTPPGASSALNFICREWTKSEDTPGRFTIQCSFEECFDP